ncbi:MAG: hypothetical protein WBC73_08010 [Phormidesmis sp.]
MTLLHRLSQPAHPSPRVGFSFGFTAVSHRRGTSHGLTLQPQGGIGKGLMQSPQVENTHENWKNID